MVNVELGIQVNDKSRKAHADELRDYLLMLHLKGKGVILILDEAHRLSLPILEQVLVLSNLQVSEAKLLQIILSGQPGLLNTLRHPHLMSLNQRIEARCYLQKMDRAETISYINHRLRRAGF